MRAVGVYIEDVENCEKWRCRTKLGGRTTNNWGEEGKGEEEEYVCYLFVSAKI